MIRIDFGKFIRQVSYIQILFKTKAMSFGLFRKKALIIIRHLCIGPCNPVTCRRILYHGGSYGVVLFFNVRSDSKHVYMPVTFKLPQTFNFRFCKHHAPKDGIRPRIGYNTNVPFRTVTPPGSFLLRVIHMLHGHHAPEIGIAVIGVLP